MRSLADQFLTVPTDECAYPGLTVCSLAAGMVTGADSIDDMAILRHYGCGTSSTALAAAGHGPTSMADSTAVVAEVVVMALSCLWLVRTGQDREWRGSLQKSFSRA